MRCTHSNPPPILDPFCGGGIPLEAQRLGLEAHGSDLNPVAVLITKALVEIPPKFAGLPPVFLGAAGEKLGDWPRASRQWDRHPPRVIGWPIVLFLDTVPSGDTPYPSTERAPDPSRSLRIEPRPDTPTRDRS